MSQIIYPYSDEYMTFDENMNRYVLTEKYALEQLGLNLSEAVNERNSNNQQIAVRAILNRISTQVYNYIHEHCISDCLRDCVAHKIPSARKILMQAMGEQLFYVASKGDLSMSTDLQKRVYSMDENAKSTLLRTLPEVGYSLLYTGV